MSDVIDLVRLRSERDPRDGRLSSFGRGDVVVAMPGIVCEVSHFDRLAFGKEFFLLRRADGVLMCSTNDLMRMADVAERDAFVRARTALMEDAP